MSADDLKGKAEEALERQRRALAAAVNGAELLDELHRAVTRYVVFPTPEAADAAVLWIAASHTNDIATGQAVVTIAPTDKAFKTTGMQDWKKIG